MDQKSIELLAQYGYLAVFVGSLLEGETILILAGFAAHQGYLSFPVVVGVAFCGGTLGDQFFFFLGRRYGQALFRRFPALAARAEPVKKLIHRYHSGLIFSIRFMYGLRIVGPIAIGMSDVLARRFVWINMLGASVWAPLIAGAGFLFGEALQRLIADSKRYEGMVLLLIVVAAALVGAFHYWRDRRR
ncbi:MAG: DedA family protein [Betaproteobacteria bacterium]|nr:DedA family protein [Betaproteobacteria bacterium]